jgi:hypothetical protein
MSDWSASEYLTLAALVVAVMAIPITLWATRRWGERRARLLFTYRTVPLLPEGDKHGLVKVTYRDFEVPSPHLVTLRLRNVGPRDIPSDRFDLKRPLAVDLHSTMYGIVNTSPAKDRGDVRTVALGTENGYVSFMPALLRRNQEWTVEVLVAGEPRPQLTSSLIDTDVVEAQAESATALAEFSRALASGFFGTFAPLAEFVHIGRRL